MPVLHAGQWPGGYEITSIPLDEALLADVDCVAIVTDHQSIDYEWLAAKASAVVDTRNAIKHRNGNVFSVGSPEPAHTVPENPQLVLA